MLLEFRESDCFLHFSVPREGDVFVIVFFVLTYGDVLRLTSFEACRDFEG